MAVNTQLSSMAEAEISELETAGIKLTPAEIVEINALCWLVERPQSNIDLARGTPVFVGDVVLWPLTMRASAWFDRIEPHLFSKGREKTLAYAYAMAHAYTDGDEFEKGALRSRFNILKWSRSLKCKYDALIIAMAEVISQDFEPEQPPNEKEEFEPELNIGELSAFLAAATSTDAEFWEGRCSIRYTLSVLDAIVKQNKADNKPSAGDPRIRAIRAVGWAVEKIKQRYLNNG